MPVFLSTLLVLNLFNFARAAINSCNVTVTPASVQPNAQVLYNFNITNNGPNDAVWIQINRPSENFTIGSAAWAGSSTVGADQATLYDGLTIASGGSATVGLSVHAGEDQTSGDNWSVLISEDSDGSTRTTCTGSLGASVSGARVPDPDTTPPLLGAVSLTKLSSTSITIGWPTDEPSDSDIAYGLTSEYGQNKHDTAPVTEHSLKLDNLLPETGYHYVITSYDPYGNGASSTDGTFLTPVSGSAPTGTQEVVTSIILKTIIPLKPIPTENIPPSLRLTSDISTPQKTTLTLSGTAEDNEALAAIYYSLDGGKNWLPVDEATGLGTKNSSFSFKPLGLQDGNYQLSLRAIDTSSNQAKTLPQTLVIDRLPPAVGGSVITVGSQSILPDNSNVIRSLVGVDQKITLSAVGGPTSITITTSDAGSDKAIQSFNLTQSADTGLWSGILSFTSAGLFQLSALSVDGAANHTSRVLNIVSVSEAGKVSDEAGNPVKARITVYTLDTETNSWVMWDGEAYDQSNPVKVSYKGKYGLYLPQGTYYFKLAAPGYQSVVTRSIQLETATAINASYTMRHKPSIKAGPLKVKLPWPMLSSTEVSSSQSKKIEQKNDSIGTSFPQFELVQTNGKILNTLQLLGKPTVVTLVNTWSDSATRQLNELGRISEPNINVVAVASGESLPKLEVYGRIAGYNLPIVADVDDVLLQKLRASTIPVSYFIDRHGLVKTVMVGVLSKEEILQHVSD